MSIKKLEPDPDSNLHEKQDSNPYPNKVGSELQHWFKEHVPITM